MKFLMLVIFTIFSFVTLNVHAVNVVNQTTKVGPADTIKCVDGLKCSKVKNVLNLNAYHAAVATFTSGDQTPSIADGTHFNTHTNTLTITDFDDGVAGKEIVVVSKGAITFDVTGTDLKCGTTDIVTAVSGDASDVTKWLHDGTYWRCTSYIDSTDNLN